MRVSQRTYMDVDIQKEQQLTPNINLIQCAYIYMIPHKLQIQPENGLTYRGETRFCGCNILTGSCVDGVFIHNFTCECVKLSFVSIPKRKNKTISNRLLLLRANQRGVFVKCNRVDTRWQQYSTHLHTNNTQNNVIKYTEQHKHRKAFFNFM